MCVCVYSVPFLFHFLLKWAVIPLRVSPQREWVFQSIDWGAQQLATTTQQTCSSFFSLFMRARWWRRRRKGGKMRNWLENKSLPLSLCLHTRYATCVCVCRKEEKANVNTVCFALVFAYFLDGRAGERALAYRRLLFISCHTRASWLLCRSLLILRSRWRRRRRRRWRQMPVCIAPFFLWCFCFAISPFFFVFLFTSQQQQEDANGCHTKLGPGLTEMQLLCTTDISRFDFGFFFWTKKKGRNWINAEEIGFWFCSFI